MRDLYAPSGRSRIYEYIWRAFHIPQMDLQRASVFMYQLLTDPRDAYRNTRISQVIRHRWSRDDPAFLFLLCIFVMCTSCLYGIVFRVQTLSHWIWMLFAPILLEVVGIGSVVATLLQYIANKYFRQPHAEETVEWLYAFDVHCNAVLPYYLLTYGLQLMLSPVLVYQHSLTACVLSTLIYTVAIAAYLYITWLGYQILPFAQDSKVLYILRPVFFLVPLGVLLILARINISALVFEFYFSRNTTSWPTMTSNLTPDVTGAASSNATKAMS